jgi:hypothetical protein
MISMMTTAAIVQNNSSGSKPNHGKKKLNTKNTAQQARAAKSLGAKNKLV